MTDYERRNQYGRGGHGGGHFNNRKRRLREDDDYDRRPQRRRYDEPAYVKLRKTLLSLAESAVKKPEDEIAEIANAVVAGYEDAQVKEAFLALVSQLVVEQPLKIPFIAAIVLAVNLQNSEIAQDVLLTVADIVRIHVQKGEWREVKLGLRLYACLQGILAEDGVFPLLEELFSRAVDLQTASSEDGLGLELVKIILMTIAYAMASSATGLDEQANALLEKTDIIASTPHSLEALVDPYPDSETIQTESIISLLQRQLQRESEKEWPLSCIPRPWKTTNGESVEGVDTPEATKHTLPEIEIPLTVSAGGQVRLPEPYFSVYFDQDIETVPPTTDIASSIIRDSLVDTINILDYNRNITAKSLIELDCYFTSETFVKRATPFDRLKDLPAGNSTWKPEDIAVDAVFSQLFQLPMPQHKLIYFHSVLTEACKIAPAGIAPSLGRAIRYLYRNIDTMDLELSYRFMDWFAHHLSNFGFTWKWTEWVDDVALPNVHAKKAFITGALEKEIRLSFAQRIRGTLPEPYQALISKAKEQDTPDFKYASDDTPYAAQARDLHRLLRTKAPDSAIQESLTAIQDLALEHGTTDPFLPSTDALVTAICYLGSKSLSHVLSHIDRCKERLLTVAGTSDAARAQIITSVMQYWQERPGVGVNVLDKLLNYDILTPMSVLLWSLSGEYAGSPGVDADGSPGPRGPGGLSRTHVFELVGATVGKVSGQVRTVARALVEAKRTGSADIVAALEARLASERTAAKALFDVLEDGLGGVADGSAAGMAEGALADGEVVDLVKGWGRRWARVFRRKMAVEESWVLETLSSAVEGGEMEESGAEQEEAEAANGAMELETSEAKAGEGNGVVEVDEIDVAG